MRRRDFILGSAGARATARPCAKPCPPPKAPSWGPRPRARPPAATMSPISRRQSAVRGRQVDLRENRGLTGTTPDRFRPAFASVRSGASGATMTASRT